MIPIAFALIAAMGNAMFALGQKKALGMDNPFAFISVAAIVCVLLTLLGTPLFGTANYQKVIAQNGGWAILSGIGLFLTYLGFNLLYTRYGASYYTLYAVLSIITTSLGVGVFFFKEAFNTYHWMALLAAIIAIVLFSLGNRVSSV